MRIEDNRQINEAPFGVLFACDFSTTFILHFGVKNVV